MWKRPLAWLWRNLDDVMIIENIRPVHMDIGTMLVAL